jgi:hypothetical protein
LKNGATQKGLPGKQTTANPWEDNAKMMKYKNKRFDLSSVEYKLLLQFKPFLLQIWED